jgi:DNA modification methylase
MSDVRLILGDVGQVLPTLDAGFTACFCDPPYGLSFMGKSWDHGVPSAAVWRLVYDLLTPGAVLLAFGGTRTWHRLAVAIEDAGFEVFDTLMWLYGSGFPKSMDISKAIDKEAGAEREVVGRVARPATNGGTGRYNWNTRDLPKDVPLTAPATPLAAAWSGYGTALKPAWEPIIAARKPREGTYAQTAVEHGAGALWIDGCRIATTDDMSRAACNGRHMEDRPWVHRRLAAGLPSRPATPDTGMDRWPANLLLDEDSAAMLDAQSGYSETRRIDKPSDCGGNTWGGTLQTNRGPRGHTDSGGASRFFYCAKASKRERGENNHHPTVKPLGICEYLARLILPPEPYRDTARLLVPFAGSGSEMVGALQAGWRNVTGIEKEAEYAEIAKRRVACWQERAPTEAQM